MFYHKDMVEVDCRSQDIFCKVQYDKANHINAFSS